MCAEKVCGTGEYTGPKPGDPDNNITLRVVPSFTGLLIEWSYPTTNAHAVAHVRVYRSTSGTDANPAQVAVTSGSFYRDELASETPETYYYWIELVSVHGTVGERIGPAAGTTNPIAEGIAEYLTGKINDGLLSQELRSEISRIELNKLGIDQELLDRAASDDSLAASLSEMQAFTDDTRALVQEETLARAEADSAFVSTVNTLFTEVEGNTAAIQEEKLARVSVVEALAQSLETTEAQLGNDVAAVQTEMRSWVNYMGDELDEIGALWTVRVNANGLVGGFGVHNDGSRIEAGFDVDDFWIGRYSWNKVKPFIVSGSKVYIDNAVIREASITQAKIAAAAVDTLQLRGNAVTVPGTTQWGDKGLSNYQRSTVVKAYFNCEGGGFVSFFTCDFDGRDKDSSAQFHFYVNGAYKGYRRVSIHTSGGDTNYMLPICMAYNGSGSYHGVTIEIQCQSEQDDFVAVRRPMITFMGAKR